MPESNQPNRQQTTTQRIFRALGGALLFVLGIAALNATAITSFAVIYTLGWILTVGGIIGFVLSFALPSAGGVTMGITSAILSFVLGIIILLNPQVTLATFTLLLAMFFIVDGIIRIIASFTQPENRGWSLVYGIAVLILGIAVWIRLPTSSLYVFGIFIGIALILKGITVFASSFTPTELRHKPRFA